ncbi:MAG: DUF1611 domain-containing protein [bacterium]|nr:DUF1611 domain-containing protein [bacterium]
MFQPFYSSVTRISDLRTKPYECALLERDKWATGDYVICEVRGRSTTTYLVELCSGRLAPVLEGDAIIGAFGKRAATVDAVGDWNAIGKNNRLHALTSGGLFGKMTSQSHLMSPLMRLEYKGHIVRDDKVCMQNFVEKKEPRELDLPVILIIGTSMSSGKTTSGRIIIHELKRMGLTVAAVKFTGAGRYRDILSFADAGADHILDFVDAGMPSTVCPEEKFEASMRNFLSTISETDADVLIAELGASPLEPYNGSIAMKLLEKNIVITVLSALDPYAVLGIQRAFGMKPDLITGPAANTDAGISLIEKLLGIKALNLVRRQALPDLQKLLNKHIKERGTMGSSCPART